MTFWDEVVSWVSIVLAIVAVIITLINLGDAFPDLLRTARKILTKAHWTGERR